MARSLAELDLLVRQLQQRAPRASGTPPVGSEADYPLGAVWTDEDTGERYQLVLAGWKQITHA